jgi:hypothetical protein
MEGLRSLRKASDVARMRGLPVSHFLGERPPRPAMAMAEAPASDGAAVEAPSEKKEMRGEQDAENPSDS